MEIRFLEIDKKNLIEKLHSLGAKDLGEVMLEEAIIYDKELKWIEEKRFVRVRKTGEKILLTYKENKEQVIDSAKEIEFEINDFEKAVLLFEKVGLYPIRRQQKLRHTLILNGVTFDIDTWPRIPAYVELEGDSEESLRKVVDLIGYDWKDMITEDAKSVIENRYNIPVGTMHWFTFDRFE